jgi:hypothetical protein
MENWEVALLRQSQRVGGFVNILDKLYKIVADLISDMVFSFSLIYEINRKTPILDLSTSIS